MAPVETWRAVVGYEGLYEVSDLGGVRCLDRVEEVRNRWGGVTVRRRRGKLMKTTPNCNGYPAVWLANYDRKINGHLVHRLVVHAFVGPIPDGMDVAHNDGSRTNNHLSNLRIATRKENLADMLGHGTLLWGEASWLAKLTAADVIEIRSGCGGISRQDMARKFNVSKSHIDRLIRCENWRHLHE